jgi:hypothetical protein
LLFHYCIPSVITTKKSETKDASRLTVTGLGIEAKVKELNQKIKFSVLSIKIMTTFCVMAD